MAVNIPPTAQELLACAIKKARKPSVKSTLRESKVIAKVARELASKREIFKRYGKEAEKQACDYLLLLARTAG